MLNLNKIVTLLIIVLSCFLLIGCEDKTNDFDFIESGTKINLDITNHDLYLNIKSNKLEGKTKSELFYGIAFKYTCTGYTEFSYYNVQVTFEVNCEALNDAGEYVPIKFTKTSFLDEAGNQVMHDTHEFGNKFRNLKDITWKVSEVSGYIVKK